MVRNFPRPNSQRTCKFREFVGLINFYHRFLNNGEAILKHINDLLAAPVGSTKELVWTDAALQAFTAAKEALTNATLLLHHVPNTPTSFMGDVSQVTLGVVLQHFVRDKWRPIAYFSRKLKPAIRHAIKQFRHILEGRQFYALTDHKPLMYSL